MLKTRADIARLARDELASRRACLAFGVMPAVEFARDALRYEPWAMQREILSSVTRGARVAVRSGHKVGKSRAAATIALQWAVSRPDSLVLLTSSSYSQVEHVLWHELFRLSERIKPCVDRACLKAFSGMSMRNGSRILGISTNKPERAAGYSSADVLMIIDEASGIDDAIFEAFEGNAAGGGTIVMLGNPTITWGKFYDAFGQDSTWRQFRISSRDVPAGIPGLATAEWCDARLKEWGETDSRYRVRVLGEFPVEAVGKTRLIPVHSIEAAFKRPRTPVEFAERLHVGVDVARQGVDRTAIVVRSGMYVWTPVILRGSNSIAVTAEVSRVVRSIRHGSVSIAVDASNSIGLAVIDQMPGVGLVAIGVKMSDKPTRPIGRYGEYSNVRAQLWCELAEWIDGGGGLPHSRGLEDELGVRYVIDNRNRVMIEDKREIAHRLHRSPDIADALCLTFVNPVERHAYRSDMSKGRW